MSLLLATYQWRHKTVILKKNTISIFFFEFVNPNIVACVKYSQICCSKPSWPRFWHLKFPLFSTPPSLMNPFLLHTHTHTLFSHLKPDYNLEVKKNFFCQLCMNKQKWNLKVTFYAFVVKTAKTFFLRIGTFVGSWEYFLSVARFIE